MDKRTIAGREVGALGLGCMGMSYAYGPSDKGECLRTLGRALELGVNFWDTADVYGAGENEKLLSEVLKDHRAEVFLCTKFGNVYDRSMTSHQDQVSSNEPWIVDGTPEYVRRCCDLSLQRLGTDVIDLYYQHRVDPQIPVEETVGAMAELVKAGKVRNLGLSEAAAETIRRAHSVHPVTAVQSEYSLWTRDFEASVIPTCAELGITFVPYSPLGRGFLTGTIQHPDDLPEGDWRRNNPRFFEENMTANAQLAQAVKEVAKRRGATAAQVALAWVLSRGEKMIPIPGTKRVRYLEDNVGALNVRLTKEDFDDLDSLQAVGERYPSVGMKFLNG